MDRGWSRPTRGMRQCRAAARARAGRSPAQGSRAGQERVGGRDGCAGGLSSSGALSERLQQLASSHPDVCTIEVLPHRTHEEREVPMLRVGTGSRRRSSLSAASMHASGRLRTRCSRGPRPWSARMPATVRSTTQSGSTTRHTRRSPTARGACRRRTSSGCSRASRWCSCRWSTQTVATSRSRARTTCTTCGARIAAPAGGRHRPVVCRRRSQSQLRHRLGLRAHYNAAAAAEVQSSKDACDPQISSALGRVRARDAQRAVRREPIASLALHRRALLRARHPLPVGHGRRSGPRTHAELPQPRLGPHRPPPRSRWRRWHLRRISAIGIGGRAHRDRATHARRHPRPSRPHPTARHRSIYTVKQALGLYPTTGTSDDYCAGVTMLDSSVRPSTPSVWNAGSTRPSTTRPTTRAASTPITAPSSQDRTGSTPPYWHSARRAGLAPPHPAPPASRGGLDDSRRRKHFPAANGD